MKRFMPLMLLVTLLGISITITDAQPPIPSQYKALFDPLPDGYQYEFQDIIVGGKVHWAVVEDSLNWWERQLDYIYGSGLFVIIGGLLTIVRLWTGLSAEREKTRVEGDRGAGRKKERMAEAATREAWAAKEAEYKTEIRLLRAQLNG